LSSITTDQGTLHYEVYGRGKPVILLHGWLGSWGLWQQTMTYLGRYYRMYALDFWGFGDSGSKRSTYAVQDFVSLVNQFMDQLGIENSPLVGHSMGGTVSLSFSLSFPEKVNKVVVIGSPIVGSSLALPLKLAGYRWIAAWLFNYMGIFRFGMKIASPLICKDKNFPQMMDRDLTRTTVESFLTSIASLRKIDLRSNLDTVKVPVLGMYGKRDIIVRPDQWKVLKEYLPSSQFELFPNAGHFIMLEEPERFYESLKLFLDTPLGQ